MTTERWHLKVNQKGNIWYQKGRSRLNEAGLPLNLPEFWIHINEGKNLDNEDEWSVHAPTKINPETVDGTYKFFKTKSAAISFAKKYMRSH